MPTAVLNAPVVPPPRSAPCSDPEPAVKLAALSSLTHLVLGGMVKAKGNVAKVATLLVDDCQGAGLAGGG